MIKTCHQRTNFKLNFEDREAYLYASIDDLDAEDATRQGADKYIELIADHCKEMGCKRLMIEKHISDTLWFWDSVAIITRFTEKGMTGVRVALIDASGKIFGGGGGFGVEIGTDSQVDIHVFPFFKSGESWLTATRKQNGKNVY